MKKLTLVLGILLVVGLGLFLFGRNEQSESVSIQTSLCEPGDVACHADGARKYTTMTPLSIAGVILAGASAIGLGAVLGKQMLKRGDRKHGH